MSAHLLRKVKIMARKTKEASLVKEAVEEVKKPSASKKKKIEEKPEAVWIYHTGDDLEKISFELTGKKYMIYRILQYSGLNMNTLKDGAILKWGI